MLTNITTLDDSCPTYYLPLDELPETIWLSDNEGELFFFATVQDGQVQEWVWI